MSESLSLLILPPPMPDICQIFAEGCTCCPLPLPEEWCQHCSHLCELVHDLMVDRRVPWSYGGVVTCWDCNVVSADRMLIWMLSVSVEALEMLCTEALAPWGWDLLNPLHLMCDLRNPNLSCIQFWCSTISFRACSDFIRLNCVSLL